MAQCERARGLRRQVLQKNLGRLATVTDVAWADVADQLSAAIVQSQIAGPTGLFGDYVYALAVCQLLEISVSKQWMTAEAFGSISSGALVEVDQLEIVGQAEQAPERFFGHDLTEWTHRFRPTIGAIGAPPRPRNVEQRLGRNVADERLIRWIHHCLRIRPQMLLHGPEERRFGSAVGKFARRLRAMPNQPRRMDQDARHAPDDDRHLNYWTSITRLPNLSILA
jgi:hypothetical protein